MFARLFDERPSLLDAVRSGAPVVVINVPDAEMLGRVSATWRQTLFESPHLQMDVASRSGRREEFEAVYLVVKEVPKAGDKPKLETAALSALSMALPFVAISSLGTTHLPEAVTKATTDLIEFPRLDPKTIAQAIRIVTGKPCREDLEPDVASKMKLSDLIVAVRFDRTPAQCMAELRRLAGLKASKKKSRDLTLSQLHGLGEARAWAESAIADIAAWKRGEIGWDAVASSVAISGPSGCGKTLFAQVFAEEAGGLNLIACSLARWQIKRRGASWAPPPSDASGFRGGARSDPVGRLHRRDRFLSRSVRHHPFAPRLCRRGRECPFSRDRRYCRT
jgi:hypothetical protein